MSERWFLEDAGDDELGFVWNLMLLEDGRLRCVAEYREELAATQGLAAHRWLDTMADGRMSLKVEGLVIASDGRVRPAPRKKAALVAQKKK